MAITKAKRRSIQDIGFSAYNSFPSGTPVPSGSFTKVQFNAEHFDTHSYYDAAVTANGSRFQPQVPGLYQLNAQVGLLGVSDTATIHIAIYKNGAVHKWCRVRQSGSGECGGMVSALVESNGTTDYFEVFAFTAGSATNVGGSDSNCWFNGYKV